MSKVLEILSSILAWTIVILLAIAVAIGAIFIATIMLPVTFIKSIIDYFKWMWNKF